MIDDPIDEAGLDDESLGELTGRLVGNAKEYLNAEVARVRALALRRLVKSRWPLLLAAAAGLLAQAAVMVMLVGILIVLGSKIGFVWATVIVTLLALLIAGIVGRIAIDMLRQAVAGEDI